MSRRGNYTLATEKLQAIAAEMPAPQPPVFITELCDLLFYPFIKCAVDHEYSVLVKAGEATPEQLADAWRPLFVKFLELSGSKEAKTYATNVSKMENIHSKLLRIPVTVESIKNLQTIDMLHMCGPLFDSLREYGYKYPFAPETIEKDLESTVRQLQNDRLTLTRLKKEHEERQSKSGNEGPASRESYLMALHAIEDIKGREIDRSKLNAEDFALYLAEIQKRQSQMPKNTKRYA